jgi:autotransporter-associated beta strand protein
MLLVNGALAAFNGMLVATRKFWCECVLGGVCCGGECHCEEGRCCGGAWHPDADPDGPCPEGKKFFEWGVNDQCCGCLPEQIFDGRVQGLVNTADVLADLCCPVCDPLAPLLPFDLQGNFVGCKGRCCDGIQCSETLQAECAHEWSAVHCCEEGCPKSCCTEDGSGNVACQKTEQSACAGTLDDEPCETACKGGCCYYDEEGNYVTVDGSPMTKAACDAADGEFQGIGTTECRMCEEPGFDDDFRCREPLTPCCCEEKSSTGAGLTFTQPRGKRLPPFSDTVQVTVTVSTISDILVHGEYITGGPYGKCNETITFLMCWDSFNVEPVPCGSNFAGLDIKVCWDQEATDTETLKFSGCNDITVWLGNCEYDCVTTLLYTGPGHTSNATIVMRGDAVIEASGTGPLVLTTPITHAGDCARTLTLTGTNTGDNEIEGAISDRSGSYATTVVKRGVGLWVLGGANAFTVPLQVKQGTLVAGRDSLTSNGAFGAASVQEVLVGDDASNISGTATLLIDAGFSTDKVINIQASGSGGQQIVIIGGRGSGTVDYQNDLWLGRGVTLVADNGSTTFFSGFLKGAAGSGDPTVDIKFGIPGYAGEVRMLRTLNTSGTVSFLHGTVVFTNIKTNPGDLAASATFSSSALTVDFTGNPASGSQYVIFGGATQQTYTPVLTGTSATGTYNSATSTLTIN